MVRSSSQRVKRRRIGASEEDGLDHGTVAAGPLRTPSNSDDNRCKPGLRCGGLLAHRSRTDRREVR